MSDSKDMNQGGRLARDLGFYTLARLLLVLVAAAVIVGGAWLVGVEVPPLAAALFAVIIAMPLSMVLFKGMRSRVTAGIAAVDERRRSEKAHLRARLRGEEMPEKPDKSDDSDAS